MLSVFISGFFISLSLILAIGPQNSFVIRQGLLNQHVLAVVLFCGISDALLICLGVLGLGTIMAPIFEDYADWLFGISALWLGVYGLGRLRAAYQAADSITADSTGEPVTNLRSIFSLLAVLTFANPHVYLDTVVLLGAVSIGKTTVSRYTCGLAKQLYPDTVVMLGAVSIGYIGLEKLVFASGASLASLSFFASIGFGAKRLSPLMRSARAWRMLDIVTALIMFVFAVTLLAQTSWVTG